MKKLILSLMAAGVAVTSFAQGGAAIHPGDVIVYGNLGILTTGGTTTTKFGSANSNTTDNDKRVLWHINPGVGYNLTDHITVGLDGYYSNDKKTIDRENLNFSTGPQVDQYKRWDYGIGAFGRYTQGLNKHFFVYGQLTSHYLDGRVSRRTVTAATGGDSYTADDNYKGFDVDFYPAIGVNITRNWVMTLAFGGVNYNYTHWDKSTQGEPAGSNRESNNSNFNLTFGQGFSFGITRVFACHHRHGGHAEPMDDTRHIDTSDDESDKK
jgi:opacity protein-like surface antigen